MVTHNVQNARHSTLGAAVADDVVLTGLRSGVIRVRNRGAAGAPIYFRVYATGAAVKPTFIAEANDTIEVPWGEFVDYSWSFPTAVVRIVSADAQPFSVSSLPGLQ